MKKVRNILAASALLLGVSGVFAFRASRNTNSGTLWHVVGGFCVQDKTCASGNLGAQCTGSYFSSQLSPTACQFPVANSNTHTVGD